MHRNFGKPLNELSDQELEIGINNWQPDFVMVGLIERQRRQQKKDFDAQLQRIDVLINAIQALKTAGELAAETAKQNYKSADLQSKFALGIAIIGILVQFIAK